MKQSFKIMITLLIVAIFIFPATACAEQNCDKTNVDVDVNTVNRVTNNNVNNNVNNNNVNQNQQQNQQQTQSQDNNQVVIIDVLSGISTTLPSVSQLDVGEVKEYSRLVYPGEVISFDVLPGDNISVKASSDIALYTIGDSDDSLRINSKTSVPVYDPVYHRFDFGIVVPIDKIDYWTTKATLVAGDDSKFVVVDNRAPMNGYTHIEISIGSV